MTKSEGERSRLPVWHLYFYCVQILIFITWVCFLYCHLREVEWMPTVQQVKACLPHSVKEKYMYAIIDGSEIFIETPTDLQMQSSTWSNYKHHNTAKFLVACTPNGAVSFISPLYVGSK